MNDLQVFSFNDAEVRTIELNGEVWFIAKDLCDILELGNVTMALDRLSDKQKLTSTVLMSGQNREVNIISESGLYKLAFTSRKPEAEKFTDWVTGEVLPAIRKTGSYSLPNNPVDVLSTALKTIQVYKEAAELFGLKGNPMLISANVATRKDTGIDFQARLGITLLSENNERILTPTEIGQKIGLSARAVNTLLVEKLYQYKQGKNYYPTEQGESFAVLIDTGKKNSSGAMIQQLKWKEAIVSNIA